MTSSTLRVIVSAALVAVAFAAVGASGPAAAVSQSYVVVLADSAGDPAAEAAARGIEPTFVYRYALKGYAARIPVAQVPSLLSDPDVLSVEPDGIVKATATQTGAVWGLDRIDQRNLPLNGAYSYAETGAGVTAYIIDTGIRTTHSQFGGRATSGYDFIDNDANASDCNGHGTHVAGTVGGSTYGVAKAVNLVAVRVLNCSGSGSFSQVIAGVDWVTGQHDPGEPAVANMSLTGGGYAALDTAVTNSIADGVVYVVAAGNDNSNACGYSPARTPDAITMGATGSTDARASFSNYGSCLDWFAPGVNVQSAYYTSDTATATMSGTSMASPHTAGAAARYLQANPSATPSAVRTALYNLTTKDIVTSPGTGTTNDHLLYMAGDGAPPPPPPPPPPPGGPTVSSFSPTSGAVGVIVTINGTGFTGVTAVKFNGKSATQYLVSSSIKIMARVPSGATTGPISVSTGAGTGTSASNFTVTGGGGTTAPTISSFTPSSGPVGTIVTINGTNFTGATSVKFNGVAATQWMIGSAIKIYARVPAGATTGKISVTTGAGTGTSASNFTVS